MTSRRSPAPPRTAFWTDFDKDPFDALEFLENRIATAATDADLLFLRYVGTDPAGFAKSFDRMKIVDGQADPARQARLPVRKVRLRGAAEAEDGPPPGRDQGGASRQRGETIAKDPELQRLVRENSTQVREILLQLDKLKTPHLPRKLQRELGASETDVAKLLAAFFQTNDAELRGALRVFYASWRPRWSSTGCASATP